MNLLKKCQQNKDYKRTFDILFILVTLPLLLPLMGLIGLLVKLTSNGPVFYMQQRVGQDGALFTIYKFRTMYCDAEETSGPMWAQKNDPRITCIGEFLRKSHLDELPQLINVLKNEMSIVGPRPERPFFVEQLKQVVPSYDQRLHVKPGITGLAQVRHRYDETIADVEKKLHYDLHYIQNMTLAFDVKVMTLTLWHMVTGKTVNEKILTE